MQLPLDIDLHENKTLTNFNWFGNEVLQSQLTTPSQPSSERFFYLWGSSGVGKTHILQAITRSQSSNAIYLPIEQLLDFGPTIFEGIAELDYVCLDNIEALAGNRSLEEALFHLYNQMRDNQYSRLFIAGAHHISSLGISLPDLRSRLSWGLVFQLNELPDQQKALVLEQIARERGFTLSSTVAHYLLTHCTRDLQTLSEIMKTLDKASLAAKRKLTIPFVKHVLTNS